MKRYRIEYNSHTLDGAGQCIPQISGVYLTVQATPLLSSTKELRRWFGKSVPSFYFHYFLACSVADNPNQPTQVHIAYGDDVSKMIISWSTINDSYSVVKYGLSVESLSPDREGNS
ncbi:hypothetical protein Btru_075716, partial [Bulinus truncatus]